MKNRIYIILTIGFSALYLAGGSISFAMEELRATPTQPVVVRGGEAVTVTPAPSTVLAPQGLTGKERAQMEQEYRFAFKGKGALLSPYMGADEFESGAEGVSAEAQAEQEKLYRYFGVATNMYKEGRLDEAIEILKYISDKNPDDRYVRSYLERAMKDRAGQKQRWTATAERDACLLKDQELKDLIKDGVDYYKQKRFDMALLKFADVLALDPNNGTARRYYNILKDYYLKERRVEDIVEMYEGGSDLGDRPQAAASADRLLDEKEKTADAAAKELLSRKEDELYAAGQKILNQKEGGASLAAGQILEKKEGEALEAAERILDEKEMDAVVKEKRLSSLLDQADLGLTVEDIITQKKEEERRRNLFTLGPGDVIQISVRDHPELSGRAVVRLNGDVILPLVNDVVRLKGLTVEEAMYRITESMKRYVKEPYVTVSIEEYKSKTFYVIDEIGCTPFPITRANLTLRDALFIADWGDNRALGRVIVMKPHRLHPVIRKVDAFDIIFRGNLANNVRIEDGDVIYVPLTASAKIAKTLADSLRPVAAIRQARDEWTNLKWNSQQGWEQMFRIPRTSELETLYTDPESNLSTGNSGLLLSSLTLGR